jgi:hyperosmotically inducible periplasmic protein
MIMSNTATSMKTRSIFASILLFFALLCVFGYVFMHKPKAELGYVSYSGDALITQSIKSKFVVDKDASGTSVYVKTLDGAVLLSGYAKNDEEKSAVENIAHKVIGVKSVKNEVMVRP